MGRNFFSVVPEKIAKSFLGASSGTLMKHSLMLDSFDYRSSEQNE